MLDGFVHPVAPSQIKIDGNCTIRNYPASNPLSTNISFLTQPGQTDERWLVIFDNVVHTGQMSCNAVARAQDLVHQRLVERDPATAARTS